MCNNRLIKLQVHLLTEKHWLCYFEKKALLMLLRSVIRICIYVLMFLLLQARKKKILKKKINVFLHSSVLKRKKNKDKIGKLRKLSNWSVERNLDIWFFRVFTYTCCTFSGLVFLLEGTKTCKSLSTLIWSNMHISIS